MAAPWSMCDRMPGGMEDTKGCSCIGKLRKRHLVAGLSVILVALVATVTGSVLGTIAYLQAL